MKTITNTELDNLIEANTRRDLNGNCYPVLQALTELKALRHPAPCACGWSYNKKDCYCQRCGHPIEAKAKGDDAQKETCLNCGVFSQCLHANKPHTPCIEWIMMGSHLCDTCKNEFPACHASKITFGIDVDKTAKGKEADKVLGCSHYEFLQEPCKSCIKISTRKCAPEWRKGVGNVWVCESYEAAKTPAAAHAQVPDAEPSCGASCGNCIGRFDSSKCRPAYVNGVCANKDEYRPKVPDVEPSESIMNAINLESVEQRLHNHTVWLQDLENRFDALQRETREGK
jgi:hypothetical protein